jgi:ribosome biogenesis GTPase
MNTSPLRQFGWQPFFDRQVSAEDPSQHLVARVCAHHGSHVLFLSESGELSVPAAIVESATVENSDESAATDNAASNIAVGDWFLLSPTDHRAVRRLTRKTVLHRKAAGETTKPQLIAANVDTVFIVSSCNQEFNLSRIERYLALILEAGATPVVVLTKADLCADAAELRQQVERLRPGLIVETLDARDAAQATTLEAWCGIGQTIALLGSSGVGKSTLANALGGHHLATNQIRVDDDKGRHTTTARSMHRLNAGGQLIDNPGMRELQLPACEQGVADLFQDVIQLAEHCQFRNCSHRGDTGCAVHAAVDAGQLEQRRLTNYLKLLSEQARNSTSLAERRERDRKTGKLYKRIIADKRKRRDVM